MQTAPAVSGGRLVAEGTLKNERRTRAAVTNPRNTGGAQWPPLTRINTQQRHPINSSNSERAGARRPELASPHQQDHSTTKDKQEGKSNTSKRYARAWWRGILSVRQADSDGRRGEQGTKKGWPTIQASDTRAGAGAEFLMTARQTATEEGENKKQRRGGQQHKQAIRARTAPRNSYRPPGGW